MKNKIKFTLSSVALMLALISMSPETASAAPKKTSSVWFPETTTFINVDKGQFADKISSELLKSHYPLIAQLNDRHPHSAFYKAKMKSTTNAYIFRGTYNNDFSYYSPSSHEGYDSFRVQLHGQEYFHENQRVYQGDSYQSRMRINGNANFKSYQKNTPYVDDKFSQTKQVAKNNKAENYYNLGSYKNRATNGEWRSLGYSEYGVTLTNPFFPADYFLSENSKGVAEYKLLKEPWNDTKVPKDFPNHYSYIDHMAQRYIDKIDITPNAKKYYDMKIQAAKRLLKNSGLWRQQVSNQANIPANNSDGQAKWLISYLSLANDPSGGDTAYFTGIRSDRQFYMTAVAESDAPMNRDLAIMSQTVRDEKGNIVQEFKRSSDTAATTAPGKTLRPVLSGQKVIVETVVKNVSKADSRLPITGIETVVNKSTSGAVSVNQKLKPNQSVTIKHTYTMPSTTSWRIESKISQTHNWILDNTYLPNDTAYNQITVVNEKGNFKADSIVLVDKDGNEITENSAIPGQDYKIRFKYRYEGNNSSLPMSLRVNYTLKRQMPSKGSQSVKATTSIRANLKPQNNGLYTFDTPYYTFETGVFDVSGTLQFTSKNNYEDRYNTNTSDDSSSRSWNGTYDYTVSNVNVVPTETVNTSSLTATYLVKFDVNHVVPGHVKNNANDVNIAVAINGRIFNVEEHIKQGMNKNVSVPVTVPLNGSNQTITAEVVVNANGKVYESNYENNRGNGTSKIVNPAKITVPSGSSKTHSWKQFFEVNSWTGVTHTYKHLSNNSINHTFIDYTNPNPTSTTRDMNETLKIEKVWFKSKYTNDKKMGPNKDGWVNLMDEPGKIQAGYGYELKIEVTYNTNAFASGNVLENFLRSGSNNSGKWARPRLVEALIPDNIYIQTPDNKIHSVDGDGGTLSNLKLRFATGSTRDTKKWTYSIKDGNALGEATIGKFYIDENVSNGTYKMNVFTPRVKGVSGKMSDVDTMIDHTLFDLAKGLEIQVIGSATDDISDHIND